MFDPFQVSNVSYLRDLNMCSSSFISLTIQPLKTNSSHFYEEILDKTSKTYNYTNNFLLLVTFLK